MRFTRQTIKEELRILTGQSGEVAVFSTSAPSLPADITALSSTATHFDSGIAGISLRHVHLPICYPPSTLFVLGRARRSLDGGNVKKRGNFRSRIAHLVHRQLTKQTPCPCYFSLRLVVSIQGENYVSFPSDILF